MKLPRLLVFSFVAAAMVPAFAQQGPDSAAAIVNGDIISKHDLEQRTKLAMVSSNLPDAPEIRGQVVGPLLRRLIDEDLKIQAAARERIGATQEEISAQMASIEQENRLPAGGLTKLLTAKGIEIEAMRQQVRAEIAWYRLVHQILNKRLHISDNAVASRIEAIRANLGKPEYHAAEIFLRLDNERDEAQVRDLAERLSDQMRKGAPFSAIARQFNQAGAPDGDIGWVSQGMIDDDLLKALEPLQPNMVSAPIKTPEGYYIVTVLEKRKVGEGYGGGSNLDLTIIDLNSMASASQAERDMQLQHLKEAVAPAKSCDDLARLSKQVPSATLATDKMPEAQLPAKVAPLIKDLAPGQLSEPIDTPKGRRFFAVCGRSPGNSDGLPSPEEMRRQMESEQLDAIARRYVQELQGNAVIDIRQGR